MPKRRLIGTVVSDKPDQTVIVQVERRVVHPIYRKAYQISKKFAAHDPENAHKVGERVTIEETRPLSATKRFKVVTEAAAKPSAKPAVKPAPEAKS